MSFWSRLKRQTATQGESAGVDSAPPVEDGGRYCCIDFVRFPLGGGSQLIYSKESDSAQILPSHLARLLDRCRTFKTLNGHAQEFHDFVSNTKYAIGVSTESVKEQLSELVSAGLMISDTDFLKLCDHSTELQDSDRRISTIGVVTHNRVNALERCLISYIENSKNHGRTNDFVVADDSEESNTRAAIRQMILSLKHKYDLNISYAGLEEKLHYATTLTSNGDIPPEVVNFALFDMDGYGCSIGANRNTLLLHTAGDLFLSVDDDTVCRVATGLKFEDGLALDSGNEFMEYWFFPDRESALRSASFIDEDIIGIHERLLGADLGGRITKYAETGTLDIERIEPSFFRGLAGGKARVAVTFTGLIGDSGMPAPLVYLFLAAGSRDRLLQTEERYYNACTSREMFRSAKRLSITDNVWCCQTMTSGYDNRALLPPFLPVLRNEDSLFGITIKECFRNYYFGHLPWAVLHSPPCQRSYSPNAFSDGAANLLSSNLVATCVASFNRQSSASDGGRRLSAIGRHLMEVGAMKLADFEEFVRLHTWQSQSATVAMLEHKLKSYDMSPPFWAEDVAAYLEGLRQATWKSDYFTPIDLLSTRSADEARKQIQRLVFQFGQLLYWWPQLVTTAKDLRSQECRLAVQL